MQGQRSARAVAAVSGGHSAPSRGTAAAGRAAPNRVTTLLVVAVTAVLIVAAAVLTNQPAAASGLTPVNLLGSPTGPAPVIGQAAPALSGNLPDGTPVKLSDYRGSVVWLTFGASWCQACRAENPDIETAYEAYRARGVVVIQVFMDDAAATVSDYASRVGLGYVQVPDPDESLSTEYRILGIPTHFFIGRDGVLQQIKVGTLDRDTIDATLNDLLGTGS
jgi:cytochrome c biogenesis protein CcmG, thiol:disulfide interchange protein DsbE